MTLEELRKGIRDALEAARNIAAKAESENRDLSGEEQTQVKYYIDTARKLKGQLDEKNAGATLLSALKDLDGIGLTEPAGPAAPGGKAAGGAGKTPGQRFVEADAFKSFMGAFPNGRIPETAKGINSGPVDFGNLKSLVTGASDTSAGALVRPDYAGVVDTYVGPPLVMRQLVTVGTTGSDSVEFVRETTRTTNAAPVPEATSSAVIGDGTGGTTTATAGGLKPESGFALEKDSTTVKTLAHWLPATKRSLSDAGQIRTMIDDFLTTGLDEELEHQIVNGDGTGENFDGILSVDGTLAQAWDTDLLTTTRKAKTNVRINGRARATAYAFNPEDMEKIDLLKDGNGQFYFGGPGNAGGNNSLWGLPRVESEEVPAGTGVLADWRQAVLLDREQASVQVSDSHADFFVRNLVAFLAELRAAFYIRRPAAFCIIDLTA